MPDLVNVVNVVAHLSFACSIFVLWAVSGDPPRLLKRQLFHQALATLLFNSAWLVRAYFGPIRLCDGDAGDAPVTHVVIAARAFLHGLFFISCLVELHVAASIAAVARRSSKTLELLGKWLPIVWLLAVLYTLSSVIRSEMSDVAANDTAGALLVLAIFAGTFGFYMSAVQASRSSYAPDVVLRRLQNRAMIYPALFLITGLPTVARYFALFPLCSTAGLWSLILEFTEGTLNAVAYYFFSGLRSPKLPARPLRSAKTPDVEMGEVSKTKVTKIVGFSQKIDIKPIAPREALVDSAPIAGRDSSGETLPQVRNEALSDELRGKFGIFVRGNEALSDELSQIARSTGAEEQSKALWKAYVGIEEDESLG